MPLSYPTTLHMSMHAQIFLHDPLHVLCTLAYGVGMTGESMSIQDWYNVQCLNGHIWSVPADSDLGEKAQARQQRGMIDAPTVPCYHCEDCEFEAQASSRGLFAYAYTLD